MLYKNWQIIKLYLLLLLFPGNLLAQNYISKQITTSDGLPDNNVCAILKDKSNNLWVGTNNGLALLKNKTVTIYKKKDGLAHNSCWALAQDDIGQIWIGTYGGGISLFSNGKFKNFTTNEGLPSNKIRKFLLHKNYLYVGTANGFCKINIISKKITNYIIKDNQTCVGNLARDFEVLDINLIKENIVLNTHSHGIYILKNEKVEVLNNDFCITFSLFKNGDYVLVSKNGHVDQKNSIIQLKVDDFLLGKTDFEVLPSPRTIFWDYIKTKDNLIFGAANGVEYATGGLYQIDTKAKNVNSIYGINNDKIWALYYDSINNNLYVGTLGSGLYVLDLNNKIVKENHSSTLDFKRNKYFSNVILLDDKIEIYFDKKKLSFSKDEIYKDVFGLIQEMPIDYQKNSDAIHLKFNKKGFKLKNIRLENSSLLLNTNYGLLKYKFQNENIQNKDLFLYSIDTYHFLKDSELIFYFPYRGLSYVPNTKKQDSILDFNIYYNPKLPKDIFEITRTKKHIFFISKTKGIFSLNNLDYTKFNFKNINNQFEWTAVCKKGENKLILGSNDGDIFELNDFNNVELKKIVDKSKLIGNTILQIQVFEENIIVFTEKGINFLNKNSHNRLLIETEQGVTYKSVNSASIYNNKLLFATDVGTYEIDLKKINSKISKSSFPYNIDKVFVNGINTTDKFYFNYNENNIKIELGTPFHLYPKKLLFRYKLDGLTNSYWSSWNSNTVIELPYLPKGKYKLIIEYKDLSTGEDGTKMLKQFQVNPPFWETWYFIISSVALIVIFIVVYFNRKIKNVKALALEKTNYEKRIVETKMEALQSQMNPHFVFNSLNVIQNFVIQNDTENSITYINNFSKLMRKTLEHSSEFKITINEEIKFIKLYVEVQNIRFNNKVKFITKVDPTIDKFKKLVPPMLIQPLIENCFQHAFDESISTPKITLTIKSNDTQLFITVSDNGTGFKNSSNTNKQSKALKLVEERIKLLDDKNSFIIKHLSIGVEVEITLNN